MIFTKKSASLKIPTSTLLVDGRNLFYRVYCGSQGNEYLLGKNLNGILFFFKKLKYFLQVANPRYDKLIIFFDGDSSGVLRSEIYPRYKSSRRSQHQFEKSQKIYKDSFLKQEETLIGILRESGFNVIVDDIVEADDMIAYYCESFPEEHKYIVTNDSDLYGLVDATTSIVFLEKKKLIGDEYETNHIITLSNWNLFYQVHPQNMYLTKAICGDSTDDIEGVKGLSLKGLSKLIDLSVPFELPQLVTIAKDIQRDRIYNRKSPLVAIDNLLNSNGLIQINLKLVNLRVPMLTEISKQKIKKVVTKINKEIFKQKLIEVGLSNEINTLRESFDNFIQTYYV